MTTVIIPAAGLASRLRPISNATSKSMMPVNGKPAISYIIDEIKQWADDIRIVYGKNTDIVDYCTIAYSDLPIKFFKQEYPKGPLHAVYCALTNDDIDSDDDVVIWLGDTIVLDYHHNKSNESCVIYGEVGDWDRWCLIHPNGKIIDKPKDDPKTNRALVGIYSFEDLSIVYDNVKNIIELDQPYTKGEFQISQLLNKYSNIKQVKTVEWYDCGDFPSLYSSRAKLLNRLSRSDNTLSVDTISNTITKSGNRCIGEINWYIESPDRIKPFLPTVYSYDKDYYEWYTMEFCSGTSLQDILVYENIKEDTLSYVIKTLLHVYTEFFINKGERIENDVFFKESSSNMWIKKNLKRFDKYSGMYDFVKDEDLNFITSYVSSNEFYDLIETNSMYTFIHGDLHFGNILFDFNTGKIKLIDPRGEWDGGIFQYGDIEYDLAKLYQSCFCEYMWIVNGIPTNVNLSNSIVSVLDDCLKGYDIIKLKVLSLVMMASCLPFHDDNYERQKRIWNTSIKKLKEFVK